MILLLAPKQYVQNIHVHAKIRKNKQTCAKICKNAPKICQNMLKFQKIPKKYSKYLKMRKYHAKSQQNPDKRCPDPPQPREMEPVCSPDPSQTLQNGFKTHQKTRIHGMNLFWEGKSKDSWHESFFSYVFVACAEKTHNTTHLKLRISSIEHQYQWN